MTPPPIGYTKDPQSFLNRTLYQNKVPTAPSLLLLSIPVCMCPVSQCAGCVQLKMFPSD